MRFVYTASTALLLLLAQPVSAQFLLCPDSVEISHCDVLTYTVGVDTGAVASSDFAYFASTTGSGTVQINSLGEVTYTPVPYSEAENPIAISVIAIDTARALTDTCVTFLTVTNNPPVFEPIGDDTVVVGQTDTTRVVAADADACDGLVYSLVSVTPQPLGAVTVDPASGQITFSADSADAHGPNQGQNTDYLFTVAVTDGETTTTESFTYTVVTRAPFALRLTQPENPILLGHGTTLAVIYDQGTEALGSFDLSIKYESSALTVTHVAAGPALTNANWTPVSYDTTALDTCGFSCAHSVLNLVSTWQPFTFAASADAGTLFKPGDTLALIDVLLAPEGQTDGSFKFMRWYWADCNSNTLHSPAQDTTYQSRNVFDIIGTSPNAEDESRKNITGDTSGFPGTSGMAVACDSVINVPEITAFRFVDFKDGGVKVVCACDPNVPGDLNLNGLSYEFDDLQLYINYFTQGDSVFGNHIEGSVVESEINGDGRTLTVSDLVYLNRIISGNAIDPSNLTHDRDTVTLKQRGDDIISDIPLGALHLVFEGETTVAFDDEEGDGGEGHHGHSDDDDADDEHNMSPMTLETGIVDGNTHVLIYNIGDNLLPAGEILDDIRTRLISADASDFNGAHVVVRFDFLTGVDDNNNALTPETFELRQNYPNPFNPTTTIEFALPKRDNVELSIYNMLGQKIRTLVHTEMSAGTYRIVWDGQNANGAQVASGMYLYRLKAGKSISATRKMVLLK